MTELFIFFFSAADSDTSMRYGACCANYRLALCWAQGETLGIPEDMTVKVNDFYTCMKGTETKPVRCIALAGEVGNSVACQIYDKRSSTCQSVQVGDEQCIKARHHYGLSNDIFSQVPA